MSRARKTRLACATLALALITASVLPASNQRSGKKKQPAETEDPYAAYVWPPPPNQARIKLDAIFTGLASVEAQKSRWRRFLIGISPEQRYDRLHRPFAVAFDPQGRILVTDWESKALLRFDQSGERLDVLGTSDNASLRQPMGLDVGSDGAIYVADAAAGKIIALEPDGEVRANYGSGQTLANPIDVALSPDETELYVADSHKHQIVVFGVADREHRRSFGSKGNRRGEFAFPSSLAFTPEGDLLVVDQLNNRVQMFDVDDEYVDEFGGQGVGFGNFARPKDIAVDEVGLIYVTDNAFNNVQIFDADFTLLTFVGAGGSGPGGFEGASGVAVQGDRFAVVDQLGARCQVFRFIAPKTAE